MPRITIKDVNRNLGIENSYDIINAIRNDNPQFANYVPLANAENVVEVGAGVLINETTQNDFVSALVNRIGKVLLHNVRLTNPLKKFKKGKMPLGLTIEEIFIDIAKANKYDVRESEETFARRVKPDVKALYHERNRQDYYKQTIERANLQAAFTSWSHFDSFITGVFNAIYNGAEVDEYEYMKLLIDNAYAKGIMCVESVPEVTDESTGKQFIKKLRSVATRMSLPQGSRDFNSLAVRTKSTPQDLHLFITPELQAEVDVDVLAAAFNMNKADFIGNVTVLDSLSSEGLEAVLIDQSFFMVYDNEEEMGSFFNPQGLYWNYYYHIWQTLSISRFANAVAFTSVVADPVTLVILDPAILTVGAGETFTFNTYIRQVDDTPRKPVYSLSGTATGVTIDSDTGVLTVAEDAPEGQFKVIATVTYTDKDDEEKTKTGESVVTIIPKG